MTETIDCNTYNTICLLQIQYNFLKIIIIIIIIYGSYLPNILTKFLLTMIYDGLNSLNISNFKGD